MTDFDWKKPNYDEIYKERGKRLEKIRKEGLAKALKSFYKEHPVEFICDWGMLAEPRNAAVGLPTRMPFVMFPKQKEFIAWLHERWLSGEDGIVEKSRDMGVSWLCVAFSVWMYLFYPGISAGFGSRKEDYVDKTGEPASLFWKARYFISMLPREFRPSGYEEKKHTLSMRILNPENDSSIVGEAGDNIGRGNRTAIYFVDEFAHIDHDELVEAALSETSNCKIYVSTPKGNANMFARKRFGGKHPVFTFSWHDDPRKDQAWYEAKKAKADDPVIIAQELDLDYNASTGDSWIPGELISAGQLIKPTDIEVIGQWMVGVDAAHFGDDESVLHFRRGRLNLPQKTFRKMDGPQLAGAVENELSILEKIAPIAAVIIELDGPGVSCYDQLKLGKYAKIVRGIHTGATLKDNKNLNVRAKIWRLAKEYLESPPVLMPKCPELKVQLSSVGYKYKEGLLQMQSKKEYKSKYGKSPDRADAFVLTFGANQATAESSTKKRVIDRIRHWAG